MVELKKNEQELADSVMSKVNLSKDKVNLEKHVVSLSKCVVNLSKQAGVDLGATKAQVVVVMDYSGSMDSMYRNGTVQGVIDRMLPLGLTFDDNGEVEVYRFEDGYKQLKSLTINNYEGYVNKEIYDNGRGMGGTKYAPVLRAIKSDYIDGKKSGLLGGLFGKKSDSKADTTPVFVVFVTDGDNSDKSDTNTIIRELSKVNCFIQFVGVGNASMNYLEKLDDLDGRECDNTGFVRFKDIEKVESDVLYTKVLEQFADWLRVKGFN